MDKLKLLKQITDYIAAENTGNPSVFAKKIGVSNSTLYNYLNILKDNGIPIKYNKARQTYYFTKEGKFRFIYFESF